MKLKKIYYSVNPRYFKDSNNDGIGDLVGLRKQINYLKFLGIDVIILQDIFSKKPANNQFFNEVSFDLGTNSNLIELINCCHEKNIKVMIELSFGFFKPNHPFFKSTINNSQTNLQIYTREQYFISDQTTNHLNADILMTNLLTNIQKVVKFWIGGGVDGFVIKKFEKLNLYSSTNDQSSQTIHIMSKLYNQVKKLNPKIWWYGASKDFQISPSLASDFKIFDKFLDLTVVSLGNHHLYGNDAIGKFSPKIFVKALKSQVDDANYLLAFNDGFSGKAISRWANDLAYWKQSSKSLALLQYFTKMTPNLYFGDELGLPNYFFKNDEYFNAQRLHFRKRVFQSKGLKPNQFMAAQKLQSSLNAKQAMPWNESFHGGFSKATQVKALITDAAKEINIVNQINDPLSILNFHHKVISLIKSEFFVKIFNYGTVKIFKTINNVIVIKGKYHFNTFTILVNLSNKTKSIKVFHNLISDRLIMTTYGPWKYPKPSPKLRAYEGIILIRTSKNYQKEPQMFWRKKKNPPTADPQFNFPEELVNDLEQIKEKAKMEKSITNQIKRDLKHFDQNEEQLLEAERTTLTEEEIAKTIQVDVSDVDDIENFIKNNLNQGPKKSKKTF